MVSAPVTGATSNAYLNLYLKDYNETTNNWDPHITSTTVPLTVGKGYVVWSDPATTGNATINLSGTLNDGNQSPSITYSGASYGYNLIGNPYPSYIDWDAGGWTKTNMDNTFWIWNQTAGNYGDYNGSVGTNDVTNIIPPTQGFFIHATSALPVISLTNNVRIHDNSQQFLKNSGKGLANLIRFNVKGNRYWDETVINFRPDASNTSNPYDAEKWYSFVQTAPSLYTVKNGEYLSINSLKQITENLTVPIGFIPGNGSDYTLKAEFVESFDPSTILILEDKKVHKKIDLRQQNIYQFTSASGDDHDRFALHFGLATSVQEQETIPVSIYSSGNVLYLNSPDYLNNAQLSVFNTLGQEVLSRTISGSNQIEINLPFKTAYYLVRLVMDKKVITQKVFVNQ